MNEEQAFVQAMLETPNDLALRQVFADWLEERGDPRGELLRLTHALTQSIDVPQRAELESRMQALVDEGVQAVGPFWTNTLGMRFAWIPPGTFRMGSSKSEQEDVRKHFGEGVGDWAAQEIQHRVDLTNGFFLGIHQVTQAQWQAVTGNNPSDFMGDDFPVETVSWWDAVEFCNKLSAKEGKKPCYHRVGDDVEIVGGNGYRLPTEAQWEYACRAGSTSAFCFGNEVAKLGEYAWYEDNTTETSHSVGQKKANACGIFDMHGNTFEWCQDLYEKNYYKNSPNRTPANVSVGTSRVVRGGAWFDRPWCCRSAYRFNLEPDDQDLFLGFRLALDSVE